MIGSANVERGVKFRAALAQGARRPSLPGSPGAAETGRGVPARNPVAPRRWGRCGRNQWSLGVARKGGMKMGTRIRGLACASRPCTPCRTRAKGPYGGDASWDSVGCLPNAGIGSKSQNLRQWAP